MKFKNPLACILEPDDRSVDTTVPKTTHLAVGAHPDDLEIMAIEGILTCFQSASKHFSGVIVTDGGGSARAGTYASYTDEQMKTVRKTEQAKAAAIGEYNAQIMLNYTSIEVKTPDKTDCTTDLQTILAATAPEVVYTHNLADKHDTHIAVAMRMLSAIRDLPESLQPKKLYGCEIWRDLDWMPDTEKIVFNTSSRQNLQSALVGVFDSQISGGKRYDLATMGRRSANATYFESHDTDDNTGQAYAMDLTPLIRDTQVDPMAYVSGMIDRFKKEVEEKIRKYL
ncbi:MAG: PIG-L family deacetylase [Desulfobacteraceae bacterium]|nr:PIG-L family deacetylase [Desulfobacteraceae bacterium]